MLLKMCILAVFLINLSMRSLEHVDFRPGVDFVSLQTISQSC